MILTSASPSASLSPPLLAEDADGRAIQGALDAPKGDIRLLQKLGTNPFHFDPHDAVGQGLLRGFQRTAGRAHLHQKQRRRQPVGHVRRLVALQRARSHSVHRQRKVCSRCTVRLISEPAEIIRQACVHLALPTVRILSQQSLLFGQLPKKCIPLSMLVWNSSKSLVWNSPAQMFGLVGINKLPS